MMDTCHKLDVSGDNVINSGDAHAIRTTIHLFCLFDFIKLGHNPCPNQNLAFLVHICVVQIIFDYYLLAIVSCIYSICMPRIYVNMCSRADLRYLLADDLELEKGVTPLMTLIVIVG